MPCLEVTMPKMGRSVVEKLSSNLTKAFSETTGFPADIFGIHFHMYEIGEVAEAGKLWPGDDSRPYLHIKLYGPRWRRTVKQCLVSKLTDAFVESVGKDHWKPVIHLVEYPYDNVGVEGKLLSDAFEDCRSDSFYYELPGD